MPRTKKVDRWMRSQELTAADIAKAVGLEGEAGRVRAQMWIGGVNPNRFYRELLKQAYGENCPLLK